LPDESVCYRISSRTPGNKLAIYHSTWHWASEIEAHIFVRDTATMIYPHQTHLVERCPEHTIWVCPPCTSGPGHACETITDIAPDSRYCECECFAAAKAALRAAAPRRPCAHHTDHAYMLCVECTRRNSTHYYCARITPTPHANDRMRRSRRNG
jgi:hypothetical protein